MTAEDILAVLDYQAEMRRFAATEIGGQLNKFVSAHGRAWITDQREHASDAAMARDWKMSEDALTALTKAIKRAQAEFRRAVELLRQFKDWHDAPHTTTSDTEFATCAGAIDDFLDEIDRDAAQEADPFRKIVPANPRAGADEDADNG